MRAAREHRAVSPAVVGSRFRRLNFYVWLRRGGFGRAQLPFKRRTKKLCDRPLVRAEHDQPAERPQQRPMVEHALDYARRGWPVFPVSPVNKAPLSEHGHNDAST